MEREREWDRERGAINIVEFYLLPTYVFWE